MKIIVTNPHTAFGVIVRNFDNYVEALKWVEVCLNNNVECVIEKK